MKKRLFVFIAAVAATVAGVRAEVATLKHGDQLTAFYTSSALQSALNAAVAGDIINLSAGYYTCSTINKAVTIIGAGMEAVAEHGISPTIIESNLSLNQTDANASMKLEGLCFNGTVSTVNPVYNLMVMRCKFKNYFSSSSSSSLSDANFVNCLFLNGSNDFYGTSSFTNSFICLLRPAGSNSYLNCVIYTYPYYNNSNYQSDYATHTFLNCIIYANYDKNKTYLKYADHCIATTGTGYPVYGTPNYSYNQIFATFNGSYKAGELFALTETGAKILGTDGTQIGMQGGAMPYDPKPTNIQIESCKVPIQTDANGKLNVTIKLREKETAEE